MVVMRHTCGAPSWCAVHGEAALRVHLPRGDVICHAAPLANLPRFHVPIRFSDRIFGAVFGGLLVLKMGVITLFLPPGFSQVSARKMRQLGSSRSNPTRTHHIKRTSRWGPKRISRSLRRVDQLWPSLTKVDQLWPKFDWAVLTQQRPTTSNEPQNGARSTFPGVRGGLTNFD